MALTRARSLRVLLLVMSRHFLVTSPDALVTSAVTFLPHLGELVSHFLSVHKPHHHARPSLLYRVPQRERPHSDQFPYPSCLISLRNLQHSHFAKLDVATIAYPFFLSFLLPASAHRMHFFMCSITRCVSSLMRCQSGSCLVIPAPLSRPAMP